MITAQMLIDQIEAYAPKNLAEPHDPTGLQIGNPQQAIHRVLTTLDVRPETVQEAIDLGVDFIWAHHEAMFFPAKNLDLSQPQNQMYADLIQHNIVVYASHTNLDAAQDGMNDWLATAFGVHDVRPLVANPDGQTGLGRIGTLSAPISIQEYAEQIHRVCQVKQVRMIANDVARQVQTVAILGGDGGSYWRQAQAAGADVYITADLYYHVGHEILASDFAVIDPDHHMEAIAVQPMATLVKQWQPDLTVHTTQVNTDPYTYL